MEGFRLAKPSQQSNGWCTAVLRCTLQDGSGAALNNLQQPVANLVFGTMCWVLLTANLCQIFFRVWRAHKLHKVWKRRRLVTCSLSILELIVQWVSQTSRSDNSG